MEEETVGGGAEAAEQQQQRQPSIQTQRPSHSNSYNLTKEIAAIKAQLLILVFRLDRIEQEMKYQKKINDN